MSDRWWLSAAVIAGVLAAWGSSLELDFDARPKSDLQPRKEAFAIWIGIFALQVASAIVLVRDEKAFASRAMIALAGSLVLSTVWAKVWPRPSSALVLLAATVVAWTSLAWSNHPLARAATGVYAGWLSVATTLNVVVKAPPWVLPLVASVVSSASVALGTYEPILAVVWATVLQTPPVHITSVGAALAVCTAGVVGAVTRSITDASHP